jgi:hypothetical protein
MPQIQYHKALAEWYRQYIIDLTSDINNSDFWKKFDFVNSPGWTLMHLVVEGEMALAKLRPDYVCRIEAQIDFAYGSDGRATYNIEPEKLLALFRELYVSLEKEVSAQFNKLLKTSVTDEALSGVLGTELDFYLHMLTTHPAMHCDALMKWRFLNGMKSPYD